MLFIFVARGDVTVAANCFTEIILTISTNSTTVVIVEVS
jgi:hypothetical protein